MEHQSSVILMRRNGVLAFLITVLIGYAQWIGTGVDSLLSVRSLLLLWIGMIYLGLGIGSIYFLNNKAKYWVWGYFLIEIAIGLVIVYLSAGIAWLVIFPLVSQIVISLPPLEAWFLNLAFFVILLLMLVILGREEFNWRLAFGLLCGMVFVILFSQIVLSEQNYRNDVERLYVELSEANHKLQEYTVQVEELATVQERNRLARDIHDGLGHYITALMMQIKAAQAVLESDRLRAIDALNKAQFLAEGALTDIRNSVAALHGESSLNRPLPEVIESLLSVCRAQGLVAEYTIQGQYRELGPQVELTLYRIAQEALTNVRKHALASRVDVSLLYDAESIGLTISDNGIGTENPTGGFGLLGLRERVHMLHGRVGIRTAPQQGFCIDVEVPG